MLPSRASRLVQRATRLSPVPGLQTSQSALARPLSSVVTAAVPTRQRSASVRSPLVPSPRFLSGSTEKPEVVNAEVVDEVSGSAEDKTVPPPPQPEKSGATEKHEFMAETRQLLDIVTNSIYTDKDVFLRELVSNASDALEKLRHTQLLGGDIQDPALPLDIRIFINEAANTITLQDTGIGMTRCERVLSVLVSVSVSVLCFLVLCLCLCLSLCLSLCLCLSLSL